jgi:hypothetical protein
MLSDHRGCGTTSPFVRLLPGSRTYAAARLPGGLCVQSETVAVTSNEPAPTSGDSASHVLLLLPGTRTCGQVQRRRRPPPMCGPRRHGGVSWPDQTPPMMNGPGPSLGPCAQRGPRTRRRSGCGPAAGRCAGRRPTRPPKRAAAGRTAVHIRCTFIAQSRGNSREIAGQRGNTHRKTAGPDQRVCAGQGHSDGRDRPVRRVPSSRIRNFVVNEGASSTTDWQIHNLIDSGYAQ